MTAETKKETLTFGADIDQLLNLMINALYTNKEIFLRELISNASDAIDKLKFKTLSKPDLLSSDSDLKITVEYNEKAETITITDNGIGMSREEVIENIGTIAKSGTKEFLAALTGDQTKDAQLIGKFGVGFYSAFIAADKVTLITRHAELNPNQAVKWESTGSGSYTLETINEPARGTKITLHLKKEAKEFADYWRLHNIIHKYSDHIAAPILMDKNFASTATNKDEKEKTEKTPNFEAVNCAAALWTRPKKDISDAEYREFYKHFSHDFEEPLLWTHQKVEGRLEYTSLLYIPSHPPFDLRMPQQHPHGIKLYVNRVLIMDDVSQFLPHYLRFVRGIVDSKDLSLNISRETLQNDATVQKIRSALTNRILDLLIKTADEEPDKYATFWPVFGKVLKEGMAEDFQNQKLLTKLMRFASTHLDDSAQSVTLEDYTNRMQTEQKHIYYVTGENFQAARTSPHLEIFRKKAIEVLLLSDPIDEWLVAHLPPYKEKTFKSITQGDLDLGGPEDKEVKEKQETELESLLKQIKTVLGDKIKEARITYRLIDSPACIVADSQDIPMNMQRILKSMGRDLPESKPIFELNPSHPFVQYLNKETDDAQFEQWTEVLFSQAILAEGGKLENPAGFVSQLNQLLLRIIS